MKTINKRIEIISSTLPGMSSMSDASRKGVLAVLSEIYDDVQITIINDPADLEALVQRRPDLVFVGMKYLQTNNKRIWITDYLQLNNIAYTGSGYLAHKLDVDKSLAKQAVQNSNIKTASYYVVKNSRSDNFLNGGLNFPLFVKPTDRGGGEGIDSSSVVTNQPQLHAKLMQITVGLKAAALVEQYLQGREFSVAIIKNDFDDELVAMPLELIAPKDNHGNRVLSAAVKSADAEVSVPVSDPKIKEQICVLALNAFQAIGARDYGRIDIRMDASGQPHFLEANLLPSLLDNYGNFPRACSVNANLSYQSVIQRIARLGLRRQSPAYHLPELPVDQMMIDPLLVTA